MPSKKQLDEGLKKIGEYTNGPHKTTVHRDAENNEYRVKLHINGKHHEPSDYFTNEKEDAHKTAQHMVKNVREEVMEDNKVNNVRSIIDTLYDGNLEAMQNHFDAAMNEKMGEVLADRRIAVASTMFKDTTKE